ncbi:leucine--tRNA ligase, cytoplasmic-like [Phragmites australis]|uniref:leucine--tRNA ligase, cytoplasmic-like n=1 Tax=Phragmites australis TaxID=29695 RepID=UPI002D794647|nr:leucine--tRNA ligase, cytoplasmic-like [Phragmites australis]
MSSNQHDGGNCFARRDLLVQIQDEMQKLWEESKVFEANSGDKPPSPGEKFFGNFTYPYMNGVLHLGHAFTLSKLEFAAAYHRLCGSNVLVPFAFHCTGMPIKASADKLAREMEQYGNPPVFPSVDKDDSKTNGNNSSWSDLNKHYKSRRSKAVAKSGSHKFQWEIMRSFGLSDQEIAKFKDPHHWLSYFPLKAMEALKAFGLGCDWRRSFITTDMNPFYDSFVRWQMRKLKKVGKIVKGKQYMIYSPLDGQPCADHDRASGEQVGPQEYVLIKMEVIPPFPPKLKALERRNVCMAAVTLRSETLYGQTNCWVRPDGNYGAFEINDTDVFILTARSARNLAYQMLSRVPEKPTCLVELCGRDLVGLPLKSPLALNEIVYVLPMQNILTDKGTGVVTSVPSDSPDDFIAFQELVTHPGLRLMYGVKDEWVIPIKVIPIINIPGFGNKSAEKVCLDLKIDSPSQKDELAEAKEIAYLKGYHNGTMIVGEFKGRKVQDVRPLIKDMLLKAGATVLYYEPEEKVMSRSGDECVVALTDQWLITYGEAEWKHEAIECLEEMNTFSIEAHNGFKHTLDWLMPRACSRSFGLGTRIPWDEEFLVDSLSDSTLYMAYYTIAHLLQHGDIYGANSSNLGAEQMTDEVWDYVFCDGPIPETNIPPAVLAKMKQEFEYWYPFDLRISGKDLMQNHLAFCIYNHTALLPKHYWPRGFRCNGHLMLNSEKMSKSTGNFRTLWQAIEEFSSDATRFALADAGDSLDDANFAFETANSAIMRLTKEISWMKKVLSAEAEAEAPLRVGPPTTHADRAFANEINYAIRDTENSYRAFMFKDALKTGFYDLQAARDEYRFSCGAGGMNRELLWRFMDVQTRLLTPICPHYAEHVWQNSLKKEGFVVKAGWPIADTLDPTLRAKNKYLLDSMVLMRRLLQKQESGHKKAKKGAATPATSEERRLSVGIIYVNENYDGWKEQCLRVLKAKFDTKSCSFAPDEEILEALKNCSIGQEMNLKQIQKLCMPFIKFKKDEFQKVGLQALELKLPFGEVEVLEENSGQIKRQLGLEHVEILLASDESAANKAAPHISVLRQNPPSPGNPIAIFLSKSEFQGQTRG